MRRLFRATPLAVAIALSASGVGWGCKQAPCTDAAPIVPGCGVTSDDRAVRIGQPFDEVEVAFGGPDRERDLDGLGTYFSYPDDGLQGFHDGDTVTSVDVGPGFSGTTAGGVGPGSDLAAVEAEFGVGTADPVLGAVWYRAEGIGFELGDDGVTLILIFEPGT